MLRAKLHTTLEDLSSAIEELRRLKQDQVGLVGRMRMEESELQALNDRKRIDHEKLNKLEKECLTCIQEDVGRALKSRLVLVRTTKDQETKTDKQRDCMLKQSEESVRLSLAVSEAFRKHVLLRKQLSVVTKSNNELNISNRRNSLKNHEISALVECITHQIDFVDQQLRQVISEISQLQLTVKNEECLQKNLEMELSKLDCCLSDVMERSKREKCQNEPLISKVRGLEDAVESEERKLSALKQDISQLAFHRSTNELECIRTKLQGSDDNIRRLTQEFRVAEQSICLKDAELKRNHSAANNLKLSCDEIGERIKGMEYLVSAQEGEKVKLECHLKSLERECTETSFQIEHLLHQRDRERSSILALRDAVSRQTDDNKNERCSLQAKTSFVVQAELEAQRLDSQLLKNLQRTKVLHDEFVQCGILKQRIKETSSSINEENALISKIEVCAGMRINVHRWSRLLETNPHLLSDLQGLHSFQEELLHAQEDVLSSDQRIARKKALLAEMRKFDSCDFQQKIKHAIRVYRTQKIQITDNLTKIRLATEEAAKTGAELLQVQDELKILTADYISRRWEEKLDYSS